MTKSDSERQHDEACSASDVERVPQFPRFRVHRRERKNGRVVLYYSWDGRARGLHSVPLGKDRAKALAAWELCEQGIIPPRHKKVSKRRMDGARRTIDPGNWHGLPAWCRPMFLNAERRSIGVRQFTMTPDDFREIWARCAGRCEVSGLPFDQEAALQRRKAPFAPSLDRIDSTAGYLPGNVRLVCLIVNFAMNAWGEEPLRRLAAALR